MRAMRPYSPYKGTIQPGFCALIALVLLISVLCGLWRQSHPADPPRRIQPPSASVTVSEPPPREPVVIPTYGAENSARADQLLESNAPLPEPPPPPVIQQSESYSETTPIYAGRYYSRTSSGNDVRPYTYKGGGSAHKGQKLRRKHSR